MRSRPRACPVINLGIGQPDFKPPKHILEAAEKAVRDGPHGYSSPQGLPVLRDAVAQYVGNRFKVPVTGDEVVIVPGGKVTFYFACQIFGGPGAEILYPDPGFPPYRDAARSSGATPVAYPIREEKDFGFDAEEVLSLITPATRLIIINSPANPTGGVVSRQEITRLAEGLLKHPQVAILSDEIYSHQVYDGVDFTSFLGFPGAARPHHHSRRLVQDLRDDRMAPGLRHLATAPGRLCEEADHGRPFLHQCGNPDGRACRHHRPDGRDRRLPQELPEAARPGGGRAERHQGRALPRAGRRLLCLSEHHRHRLVVARPVARTA